MLKRCDRARPDTVEGMEAQVAVLTVFARFHRNKAHEYNTELRLAVRTLNHLKRFQGPHLEIGGLARMEIVPADWISAGVLSPTTHLRIDDLVDGKALVSRADGELMRFAGTGAGVRQTAIPLRLLVSIQRTSST